MKPALPSDIDELLRLSKQNSKTLEPPIFLEMTPGKRLQYKEPDDFQEEDFTETVRALFCIIRNSFDEEWDKTCDHLNDLDIQQMAEKCPPLKKEPYSKTVSVRTKEIVATEACAVSDDCLGYSMTFKYKQTPVENFSLHMVYERSTHMVYISVLQDDPNGTSSLAAGQTYLSMLANMAKSAHRIIPKTIDGLDGSAVFIPDEGFSEEDAKAEIDDILAPDAHDSDLPYVFFTKMLGFAFPLSSRAAGEDDDDGETHSSLYGIAHPIMIDTRAVTSHLYNAIRKSKMDVRLPKIDSGFALITWPGGKNPWIIKPEDCIDEDSRMLIPFDKAVADIVYDMLNERNSERKHLTVPDVSAMAQKEQEARETAIRNSALYKALEDENKRLTDELAKKADAPAAKDSADMKALEAKIDELRVANGKQKMRIEALEKGNAALREKKNASTHSIALNTDGITEMYDNELYLQIMSILTDALPNLRSAGAARRIEIIEALLSANGYDGEMDRIHDSFSAASRSGRKDDLYSELAKYGIEVENKAHPEVHFKNGSTAQETLAGTPSDPRSLLNSAKQISKTMF